MSLGDSYATLVELKARLGITDTSDDARLTAALAAASRGIDKECHRQFNDAGAVSARVFEPVNACHVTIDDFSTTTGLVIAVARSDTGVYGETWSAADYQLKPLNGVVGGEAGWPYWKIQAVQRYFPSWWRRPPVQVTARWGWAAVPAPVKEACLVVASEIFKLKDAPFGVAGYGDFGPVRVRQNPIACAMIAPYRRDAVLVA